MVVCGAIIWALVVTLSLYASRWKRGPISEDRAAKLILLGGVAFPVVVLTALLTYALWLMPSLRPFAGGEQAARRIEIIGNQFWWRVIYHRSDGTVVVSANEVRLPAGERVEFQLKSADMIHSFWIPALGGKMDLIPGRTNRLSLRAERTGVYRGQCAEFCGTSHALMAFAAVAMEPVEFEAWLDMRSRPSTGVRSNADGRALFERERCGDCHRVDGMQAQSTKGPDLSHLGSRLTIAAGQMNNDTEALARFIANPRALKPGANMPGYPYLSPDELKRLARWLKGLQ